MGRGILVTGANGFVGNQLCRYLTSKDWDVSRSVRSVADYDGENVIEIGSIDGGTEWHVALIGVDTIVHLAARVHVMDDFSPDPLAVFRQVNVDGTLNLARQAAAAGVKRFIYLSSIKVNGEETTSHPFTEEDSAAPRDPYGQSKFEAEKGLFEIARQTGLEVVVVRPPLVYGPEVRANFLRLLGLVKKGIPFPFGSAKNQRSLIFLDNLIDFLVTCIDHPDAAGEIFLISDGEDLSIPALIQRMATHMDVSARLVPVPVSMLRFAGKVSGKSAEINRLCGSLQVDIGKASRLLGWHTPFTVDEGLKKTVDWYLQNAVDS